MSAFVMEKPKKMEPSAKHSAEKNNLPVAGGRPEQARSSGLHWPGGDRNKLDRAVCTGPIIWKLTVHKIVHKVQSDQKTTFVNNIKLDKKKESKTTPHVHVKISAYDKVVQLVTKDNTGVKPPKEEQKKVHMSA